MTEKGKEIKSSSENKAKVLNEDEMKDIEKDIENYMKFKVPRNQKTSLIDPLDILIKEPKLIPFEKQLQKYKNASGNNNSYKKIKIKKYNSGL